MSYLQKTFENLKVTLMEDSIVKVTLDNHKACNAITEGMIDSIEEVFKELDLDSSVKAVILTGAGKAFCAGGDIKAMKEASGMFSGDSETLRKNYIAGIQRIPRALEHFSKPLIAMVNGAAIGAGCDLACMCDLRVASESAKFGETFARLSLVPGDGGTFFLQRVVGYAKAMEMFLTTEIYSAKEALDFKLINILTKDNDLEGRTINLARKIIKNGPVAISMTKQALKSAYRDHLDPHLQLLAAYQGIAQRTEDHKSSLGT